MIQAVENLYAQPSNRKKDNKRVRKIKKGRINCLNAKFPIESRSTGYYYILRDGNTRTDTVIEKEETVTSIS